MAVKRVDLPSVGQISLYKRRGAKSIKLSISHDGDIRVTLPAWSPYSSAIAFVQRHEKWIISKKKHNPEIKAGARVGKAHQIKIVTSNEETIKSKIIGNEIRIYVPREFSIGSSNVQQAIKKAATKALRKQADQLLPGRLEQLSKDTGLKYNSIKIRYLKSRWGSCSNRKEITLNLYLMLLPWHLIDYVLMHELTHTKVLAHNQSFWEELKEHCPKALILRNEIKQYKPAITGVDDSTVIS